MATNSVSKDWNSVLSTAQAGLSSTQKQIKDLEAQAAPLRKQVNDAKTALNAQQSFYDAAIQKYRPNPVLSEILYLEDAWKKDPNNAAKKAAWDKAYALFQQQSKVLEQETAMFPGIISSLQRQYSDAQSRYSAVWNQLPPLYDKEAQYNQQISQAQSSLETQAKGTTPENTTTVSATTVPASSQPGNASVATTTTNTTITTRFTESTSVTSLLDGATTAASTSTDKINYSSTITIDPSKLANASLTDDQSIRTDPTRLANTSLTTPLKDDQAIIVDPSKLPPPNETEDIQLNGGMSPSDYEAIYSAESQATQQDQANFLAKEDWRVRLSLAPGAKYLYNAPNPGILKPLRSEGGTDGVIFPYTPGINVTYAANYEATNIVHSNYKIFQYSGSAVEQVTITCDFTAQDVYEANYLLAVIHFFRSMTKMFYGQDTLPKNGTPPPLCYMFGMGGYQFAAHPLAISGFSYNLPADVDYIKTTSASPAGEPNPATAPYDVSANRLSGTGVNKGGNPIGPTFSGPAGNETVSWVPTKINISINCIPIMSRNAVSNRFSLEKYADGTLLLGTKQPGGGMW